MLPCDERAFDVELAELTLEPLVQGRKVDGYRLSDGPLLRIERDERPAAAPGARA